MFGQLLGLEEGGEGEGEGEEGEGEGGGEEWRGKAR